jgi:imidazolonepropionase-like amidohydrolase
MNIIRFTYILMIFAFACKQKEEVAEPFIVFVGATIIDGTGADPIQEGVLVIHQGRIVDVGKKSEVDIPESALVKDVSGKTIMPGIINGHGHVGDVKGINGGNYSRDNVVDNLSIYARYGITTVVSLGGDKKECEPVRAVNDTLSENHARLFIAGEVINGETTADALAVVDSNHHMGVDFMKIRVDDNLGTSPKMTEEMYRAIINHSHNLGYKIATHMYYLEDARKLLDAGSDFLAHSVRDLAVDDAFIGLIKEKNVAYCPTLTREISTFVYADTAEFFDDPFFLREFDSVTIQPLKDPARQLQVRNSEGAKKYRQQLPTAMANLKTLSDNGVPIVFGTDSGVPTRFIGYFEHIEMKMMQDAGLTPMQIIVSASKNAAEYLGLKDLGTLSPGHWADFIVLNADPLTDITNARKISSVYIGGDEVTPNPPTPFRGE